MTVLRIITLAAMGCCIPGIALAQTTSKVSAEVYGSAGYSANPFGSIGDDTGSGFGEIGIRPRVELRTERDIFTLSGDAQLQQYFRRYSSFDNYNVALDYAGRPSSKLTTSARVNYANTVVGAFNQSLFVETPETPEVPVTGTDIGLFGQGSRRQNISGSAGLGVILTERQRVNVSAFAADINFQGNQAVGGFATQDYTSYGGSASYSNRLSSTVELGASGSVAITDYRGGLGQTRSYTGSGTFNIRINSLWTANGSVGVSYVERDIGNSQAAFSGSVALCRRGERSEMCANASRQVLPSAFAGTQNQTGFGVNWRYRLTERGTISAQSSYTDVNGDDSLFSQNLRYWATSANYQHRVSQRLFMTTSAFYRAVYGSAFSRGDDFGGKLGFSYRFGTNG